MSKFTYTQRSVAWPNLHGDWGSKEELNIVIEDDKSTSEFVIRFYDFGNSTGVRFEVFGDGMDAFYDPRMQLAIWLWRNEPDPDKTTPARMIEILESARAKPSKYQLNPQKW
jgi:hypothetical protein